MTSFMRLFCTSCPVIGFSISCPDAAAVRGVSIVASVQLRLGGGKNLLIIDWRPGAWHPAARTSRAVHNNAVTYSVPQTIRRIHYQLCLRPLLKLLSRRQFLTGNYVSAILYHHHNVPLNKCALGTNKTNSVFSILMQEEVRRPSRAE